MHNVADNVHQKMQRLATTHEDCVPNCQRCSLYMIYFILCATQLGELSRRKKDFGGLQYGKLYSATFVCFHRSSCYADRHIVYIMYNEKI